MTRQIRAVILVGSRDFNRCPLASRLPTALWPVVGKPVVERLLTHLAEQGIERVAVCSNGEGSFLAESIRLDNRLQVTFHDELLPELEVPPVAGPRYLLCINMSKAERELLKGLADECQWSMTDMLRALVWHHWIIREEYRATLPGLTYIARMEVKRPDLPLSFAPDRLQPWYYHAGERSKLILAKSKEDQTFVAEVLRRHGIAFMTNNMLGLPTGSLETDLETLELNVQCRPAYANVFLFQPYPKTALGERAYEQGWMTGSFDSLSGSVSDDTVIRFGSEAEKRQIENLQKLLALGVEFPWLVPVIRRLIRVPSNRLFWLVYKLWKGWAIKRRMFPFKMTPREYLDSALYYMRITSQ